MCRHSTAFPGADTKADGGSSSATLRSEESNDSFELRHGPHASPLLGGRRQRGRSYFLVYLPRPRGQSVVYTRSG